MIGRGIPLVDLAEVYPGERPDKVRAALDRFALEEASDDPQFELGHAVLAAVFGPTGEIERRDTLLRWFEAGSLSEPSFPIQAHYHLLLARDRDGALAGVRDCFVTVDAAAGLAVVLLSHTFVFPDFRRSGVASLLRCAPVGLARRALHRAGVKRGEVLLVAEMELVDPADRACAVRLFAYGKAGYGLVPPEILPYAQPDFRDPALATTPLSPLPFLAVVRAVGEEDRLSLPWVRVEAIVHHLQAVHRCHCRPEDLAPIRDHALAGLARWRQAHPGAAGVGLVCPSDARALLPFLQSVVLPLYPEPWGSPWQPDTPDAERAALLRAWEEPEPAR